MKTTFFWMLTFLLLVLQTPGWGASNKSALVIGNGAYRDIPLRNPVNDAQAIAAALEKLGFRVTQKTNVTQPDMENAIREFGQALKKEDVALFYFSGHGIQVNGVNYLIPIGADIRSEDEVKYKAVDAGMVLDKLETAGNQLNIVILDACRNNPYKGARSMSRGLAVMSAPPGALLAYATAPGSTAADGEGENSPYTKHLLEMMNAPGLKIEEVFKKVRVAVMADTENQQVPWEASSLTGDFYFIPISKNVSVNDGLVAFYPFNGNANDESGNRNHGVVHGATLTVDRFGNSQSAYYFDGIDDYIDCGNQESLNMTTNMLTITAWIKPERWNLNGMNSVVSKEKYAQAVYVLMAWNGNWGLGLFKNPSINGGLASKQMPPIGDWSFVTATYDGTKITLYSYIHGQKFKEEYPYTGGFTSPKDMNLTIGTLSDNPYNEQRTFSGMIDDIYIYNHALTEKEIEELYKKRN